MKDSSDLNTIGLGWIFLGTQKSTGAKNKSFVVLGVYIPTIRDWDPAKPFVGIFSDYYHFPKYTPETITVTMNYAYHHAVERCGFIYGLEIGPDIAIPINSDGDTEIREHYPLKADFRY